MGTLLLSISPYSFYFFMYLLAFCMPPDSIERERERERFKFISIDSAYTEQSSLLKSLAQFFRPHHKLLARPPRENLPSSGYTWCSTCIIGLENCSEKTQFPKSLTLLNLTTRLTQMPSFRRFLICAFTLASPYAWTQAWVWDMESWKTLVFTLYSVLFIAPPFPSTLQL